MAPESSFKISAYLLLSAEAAQWAAFGSEWSQQQTSRLSLCRNGCCVPLQSVDGYTASPACTQRVAQVQCSALCSRATRSLDPLALLDRVALHEHARRDVHFNMCAVRNRTAGLAFGDLLWSPNRKIKQTRFPTSTALAARTTNRRLAQLGRKEQGCTNGASVNAVEQCGRSGPSTLQPAGICTVEHAFNLSRADDLEATTQCTQTSKVLNAPYKIHTQVGLF